MCRHLDGACVRGLPFSASFCSALPGVDFGAPVRKSKQRIPAHLESANQTFWSLVLLLPYVIFYTQFSGNVLSTQVCTSSTLVKKSKKSFPLSLSIRRYFCFTEVASFLTQPAVFQQQKSRIPCVSKCEGYTSTRLNSSGIVIGVYLLDVSIVVSNLPASYSRQMQCCDVSVLCIVDDTYVSSSTRTEAPFQLSRNRTSGMNVFSV